MAFSQITPNPLPYDRTLNLVGNATYKNTENFDMWGSIIINSGITLANSAPFNINSGRLTNSGQIINSDNIHFANFESLLAGLGNALAQDSLQVPAILENHSHINNFGTITGHTLIVNFGFFNNHSMLEIEFYFYNESTSTLSNIGPDTTTINNAIVINDGSIINAIGGSFLNSSGGEYYGTGTISGGFTNKGIFNPGNSINPGNSTGGHKIIGNFDHLTGGLMQIELGGTENFDFNRIKTEHDFTEITGDLIVNGGKLEVSLIDDFKLQRGQEFIIAKVDGELIGKYDGLDEGSSVGHFDSIYGNKIGLNITYAAGNGNDIALYTEPLTNPDIIFNYV